VQRVLLWAFLAAALTVSLLTATQRFRVERRNRAVELIADYSEIAQLAIASDRSTIEALKTLNLLASQLWLSPNSLSAI
jgi:hypothetical protein